MVRAGTGIIVLGVALAACAVRAVPSSAAAKGPPCPSPAPDGAPAPPAGSSPSAGSAPQTPAAPAPLPDEDADCHGGRRSGSDRLEPTELAAATKAPWLWPPLCGSVPGWAGIGMVMSGQAVAFAADGKRLVACGTWNEWQDACDVLDLRRDAVVQRVRAPWPGGPDGSQVTTTHAVKKLFRDLGAPAPEGRFPYPAELRVSWTDDDRGALYVSLVLLATGDERVVHRFPSHAAASEQPMVLTGARLSPDGGILEVDAFSAQGGAGFEVGLVNLHAEAAAMFRAAAANGGAAWTKRAERADERARGVARTFGE